jgi:hypothetical protein
VRAVAKIITDIRRTDRDSLYDSYDDIWICFDYDGLVTVTALITDSIANSMTYLVTELNVVNVTHFLRLFLFNVCSTVVRYNTAASLMTDMS